MRVITLTQERPGHGAGIPAAFQREHAPAQLHVSHASAWHSCMPPTRCSCVCSATHGRTACRRAARACRTSVPASSITRTMPSAQSLPFATASASRWPLLQAATATRKTPLASMENIDIIRGETKESTGRGRTHGAQRRKASRARSQALTTSTCAAENVCMRHM